MRSYADTYLCQSVAWYATISNLPCITHFLPFSGFLSPCGFNFFSSVFVSFFGFSGCFCFSGFSCFLEDPLSRVLVFVLTSVSLCLSAGLSPSFLFRFLSVLLLLHSVFRTRLPFLLTGSSFFSSCFISRCSSLFSSR